MIYTWNYLCEAEYIGFNHNESQLQNVSDGINHPLSQI